MVSNNSHGRYACEGGNPAGRKYTTLTLAAPFTIGAMSWAKLPFVFDDLTGLRQWLRDIAPVAR